MRTITLALLMLGVGQATYADDTSTADPDSRTLIDVRTALRNAQDQIVRSEMTLTADEAAAFWPAYDRYHQDLKVVRDVQAVIIETYLRAYWDGQVTDRMATDLVDRYLEVKQDILKVRRKHLKRFRKILPPKKLARFYQLEIKFDADIDAQLALTTPLMETD